MNALQIVQEVCDVIGITRPNSIIGSSDAAVRQLLGLLNKEGKELADRYAWQGLIREATFVTVAQEDQGTMTDIIGAANAFNYVLNETMWNRDRTEPVCGPRSSIEWQGLKTLDLSGPYTEYRIRGHRLLFLPAPAAGENIYFEYVTQNWCTSADGITQKLAISNDEDVFLIPDRIMQVGLEWRWRKAKGLSYTEEFNAYERMVADATSRDGTKRTLSLSSSKPRNGERFIAVSPGSWPLS